MDESQRNLAFLQKIVRKIYAAMKRLEFHLHDSYPNLPLELPEEITFVHSEEALARYPKLSPREREDALAREYGAIFLVGIGGALSDGTIHDGRAPDYDDWSSPNDAGYRGLNGDIIFWNPVLDRGLELSSMGIRVSPAAMAEQLRLRGQQARQSLYFHRRLLAGELPQSVGGGIGQSRLCMHFLHKAHIGEIQVGLWPQAIRDDCAARGITLL
jgi:aspartate--ammonia ligase